MRVLWVKFRTKGRTDERTDRRTDSRERDDDKTLNLSRYLGHHVIAAALESIRVIVEPFASWVNFVQVTERLIGVIRCLATAARMRVSRTGVQVVSATNVGGRVVGFLVAQR